MWDGLGSLEALDMYSNDISSIQSGAFEPLLNLKILDLSSNPLVAIRNEMWNGPGLLETLNLGYSRLGDLQAAGFASLKKLKVLYIWQNTFTDLRGDMSEGLDSLERLHLADMNITSLDPGNLYDLPKIGKIWLMRTKVTTLSKGIFDVELYPEADGHPATLTLHLRAVSLQCDQHLCWMKRGERDGWLTLTHAKCANHLNRKFDMVYLNR